MLLCEGNYDEESFFLCGARTKNNNNDDNNNNVNANSVKVLVKELDAVSSKIQVNQSVSAVFPPKGTTTYTIIII